MPGMFHSRDPLLYVFQRICIQSSTRVGGGQRQLCSVREGVRRDCCFLERFTKTSPVFSLNSNHFQKHLVQWYLRISTVSCCFLAFPTPGLGVSFLRAVKSSITYLLSSFQSLVIFPLLSPCSCEIKKKNLLLYLDFKRELRQMHVFILLSSI